MVDIFDLSQEGEITSFNKSYAGSITLESSYDGIEILSIGANACANCKLSSINMSKTHITSIKPNAFLRAYDLVLVIFPYTIVSLGGNSFVLCKISSIHIPASLNSLTGAFNQNFELDTITVDPSNEYLVSINNFVFSKDLTTIFRSPINIEFGDIPHINDIISIRQYAFTGSTISRFVASPNLTIIDGPVFANCYQLEYLDFSLANIEETYNINSVYNHNKYLVLPKRARLIPSGSIQSPNLTTLIIPSSLEIIQVGAFSNLISLRFIYIFETTIRFSDPNIFSGTFSTEIKCYVHPFYPSVAFGGIAVIFGSYYHLLNNVMKQCSTYHAVPFLTSNCSLAVVNSLILFLFVEY